MIDDSTRITRGEIESLYDVKEVEASVHKAIDFACEGPKKLVRFISRYANLNAWFGSGVASLSGKIGRSRGIFVDPTEPILDIADRSVLVASYFFDAARDEFDDRDTPERDTHRCLAQACIKGMIGYYFDLTKPGISSVVNKMLEQPLWLTGIGSLVAAGYGVTSSEQSVDLFRSMGYHLGSEILADFEFSYIDKALRKERYKLVDYLKDSKFTIAGVSHKGYAWIGLHSGEGSAKEVDHFNWAVQGVQVALGFVPAEDRAQLRHQVHLGIQSFVHDHQEFFAMVSRD